MCLVRGGPHFTPKGVSIRAASVPINMQPLRGCRTNFSLSDIVGSDS
jgi:hypothetical protein